VGTTHKRELGDDSPYLPITPRRLDRCRRDWTRDGLDGLVNLTRAEAIEYMRDSDKGVGYTPPPRGQEIIRRHRERRQTNRSLVAERYGADPEAYKAARLATVCPACGRAITNTSPQKRGLHLHHDHTTGKFVAFLCWRCNLALGAMNDDLALMRLLVRFVERCQTRVGA
jgi:Recombination endonuclease VII